MEFAFLRFSCLVVARSKAQGHFLCYTQHNTHATSFRERQRQAGPSRTSEFGSAIQQLQQQISLLQAQLLGQQKDYVQLLAQQQQEAAQERLARESEIRQEQERERAARERERAEARAERQEETRQRLQAEAVKRAREESLKRRERQLQALKAQRAAEANQRDILGEWEAMEKRDQALVKDTDRMRKRWRKEQENILLSDIDVKYSKLEKANAGYYKQAAENPPQQRQKKKFRPQPPSQVHHRATREEAAGGAAAWEIGGENKNGTRQRHIKHQKALEYKQGLEQQMQARQNQKQQEKLNNAHDRNQAENYSFFNNRKNGLVLRCNAAKTIQIPLHRSTHAQTYNVSFLHALNTGTNTMQRMRKKYKNKGAGKAPYDPRRLNKDPFQKKNAVNDDWSEPNEEYSYFGRDEKKDESKQDQASYYSDLQKQVGTQKRKGAIEKPT